MLEILLDALSWLCFVAGGVFLLAGGVGLVRLPDFFTRLHAASLTDTLGAGLVLGGLALQAGLGQVSIKLALILAFLLFTSPAATHALAKAALHGGLRPLREEPGASEGFEEEDELEAAPVPPGGREEQP